MNIKRLLVLSFTMLLAFASLNVKAQDWGTSAKPLPVKNKTALESLRDRMNSGATFYFNPTDSTFSTSSTTSSVAITAASLPYKYFKLMADIDLNPGKNVAACDGDPNHLGGDPIEEWVPFNSFKGHLDGGYHVISGVLVIDHSADKVGFVKEMPVGASIKNLGIVNSYFSGKSRVGGLVGYMTTSTVTHCFVDAVIVGFMEPSTDGTSNPVGGIVGEATTGSIIDTCYTTGSITSRKGLMGGICGNGSVITLRSCYSSMVLNYSTSQVGGIAGDLPISGNNGSTVTNCYYDKQMCAFESYGTGKLTTDMLSSSWTDLGNNFEYTDDHYPMLKGFNAANAYVKLSTVPLLLPETPSVQTMQSSTSVNFNLGGGNDVSWESTEERYIKVVNSVAEVKTQGWLQLIATLRDTTRTIAFYTHNPVGIGTEANPFPIDDFDDLTIFRIGVNSKGPFNYKHYVVPARAAETWFLQTDTISLASVDNWQGNYKIGKDYNTTFGGIYDGGGNAITDLKITNSSSSYGGFFGFIDGGAVKNLDVVVAEFTTGYCSAPLCAVLSGNSSVDNCRSFLQNPNTVLTLKNYSSGLIGLTNKIKGTISNCQNNCNISVVGSVSCLGGVIGYNGSINVSGEIDKDGGIDSLVVRKCINNGSITGIQTSEADILVDKVGGITSQLYGVTGKKVWFDSCTNNGAITILNNYNWTQVAGIFARCAASLSIKITYCSNYGNLTASYSAAGIVDEVAKGSVETLHHCVNAGDILVKDIKQTRPGSAYGIIRGVDVYSSLNAGKVTAEVGGTAFGITNYDSYDCINAGEVTSHSEKWCSYPLNSWDKSGNKTAARNLNIGRINGSQAFWGTVNSEPTNVADKQMVFDAHTSENNISRMETSEMLGEGLKNDNYLGANNENWVFTDGMYPRIKGLENLPISIVTATPVIFGTGQTINSVNSNFHVGCSIEGVEWTYNGQPVNSTCSGNKREVNLGTDVYGVKTLTVTYQGVSKTVRFCRKVNTPSDILDVTSVSDLKIIRDGVNSGGPFVYKGTPVPARAAGTKFKQTTSLDLGGEINWEPIGKMDAQFNGTYVGDTIRNLKQSDMQNGGLFGWGYYATIDNVHMVNVKIAEARACAGSVLAVGNFSTIKNCSASGEISGSTLVVTRVNWEGKVSKVDKTLENNLGGILGNGYNSNVTSCVNYCKMTGYELSNVGGIVGRGYYNSNNTDNMVDSCANYAIITGDYTVGGLVGANANVIKNSYNAGEVIGMEFAEFIGGLAGHGAYVENSFNTAMVSAAPSTKTSYVGGLLGQVRNTTKAEIKNCYNAGIVEANRMYVGGIFGGSTTKNEWNSDKASNIKVHHNYVCNSVNSDKPAVGAIFGYHIADSKLDNTDNKISNNYYDTTFCYVKGIGRKDLSSGFVNNTDITGMAEGRGTRQMVGDRLQALLGANNFTYGDTNFYPRGLNKVANWPASLAASARLQLEYGQLSKSVDSNFTVGGCDSSVTWGLKDGGNAIIFKNTDCTNNACAAEIQKLGVVYAQSSHSGKPYKAVKLYVGNSVTNPLEIVNKTELLHFRDFINSGNDFFYNIDNKTFHANESGIANAFPITDQGKDLYFKLTCDAVDLSDIDNWTPIGTSDHPFKGFFNGGNHTITDMKCTADKDTIGFFGYLEGGSIDSLYFTDAKISGAGSYKGVVCGYNNQGQIRECKNDNATITLTGTDKNSWGGICGYNNAGQVSNCTSTGCRINNDDASVANVGGVVGYGFDGTVEGCTVTDLEFAGSAGINNGGICGKMIKHHINDCHVANSSFTFNSKYGGGICGSDTCGSIKHCSFINSTIDATMGSIGGILGDGYSNEHSYDIHFEDCYTEGGYIKVENGGCAGGLIGSLSQVSDTYVIADGCRNNIPVEGKQYVGGIAGEFGGKMSNCYNTATVKGEGTVGGLIGGSATYSYMWDCYNLGDVEATGDYAGGLIGKNPTLQISSSFNSGRVKGYNYVGGLTGESGACEKNSYNAGQVYGGFYVGGLSGRKYYFSSAISAMSEKNYNIGYVYGNNLVGAVFGVVDSTEVERVQNNYYDKQFSFAVGIGGQDVDGKATGKLTSEMTGAQLSLGDNWITDNSLYPQVKNLHDSAFSAKASQATASPFILPKSMVAWNVDTVAVQKDSLYGVVPSGTKWKTGDGSMVLKTDDGSKFTIRKVGILDVVAFDQTSDSLYKRVRLMVEISEEYPIVIKDYTQLSKFRDFINAGTVFYYDADNEVFYSDNDAYYRRVEIPAGGESVYFKLAKNIDFSIIPGANPWTPIGSVADPFKGHFNGGGTTISNMTISDASGNYHGFFGYSTGTIQNLNVLDANVTGNQYSAAVCGYNIGGSIIHCAAIGGSVTGNGDYTGGVCAYSENGTINACYNSAHVRGFSYVGGICSKIENGVVSECFNMGRIEAPNNKTYNYCGGIAGRNTALMSDCYNTGIITGGNNVGGVVGLNMIKKGLTRVYNAGTVTAPGVVGGLANATDDDKDYYPAEMTCYTQEYMAPGVGSVNTDTSKYKTPYDYYSQVVPSKITSRPQSMMGTALQDFLGTDKWVFTDSLYPRLKIFATSPDSMASYVSASPIFLDGSQTVRGVSSSFVVYDHFQPGQEEDLTWAIARPTDALDTTYANTTGVVGLRGCEEVTIKVLYDSLEREVDLLVKSDRSYLYKDTTCGEAYLWAYNQVYYNTTGKYSESTSYGSDCHESNILELVVPDPLALTLTPGMSCGGGNQGGAVTAEISGGVVKDNTHLYHYKWSKEGETDIFEGTTSNFATLFENLSEGTYTLTVKDANVTSKNCQVTQTINIGTPALLNVSNVEINEPCSNDNGGTVSFNVQGGNAPYKISWNSYLGVTGSDSLAVAGTFTKNSVAHDTLYFHITDNNGCSVDTTITVAGDTNKYEIIAYSETKTYDGQSINPQQYKLKVNGVESATWFTPTSPATLGTDTTFVVQFDHPDVLVNAGTTLNTVSVMVKKGEQDITCRLNLTTTSGSIVINKKEVTLISGDSTTICPTNQDCSAFNHTVNDGGGIVAGDVIHYTFGDPQNDIGFKSNTFDYSFEEPSDANNYSISKEYGLLAVIHEGEVLVSAKTKGKTYDGTPLGTEFVVLGLVNNNERVYFDYSVNGGALVSITTGLNNGSHSDDSYPSITNVGSANIVISNLVIKNGENPVAYQYHTISNGQLTITPRTITLHSNTNSKVYDGTPLKDTAVTIEGDYNGLFASQVENLKATTSVTDYTTGVPNEITYTGLSTFIAGNYIVETVKGTLSIDKKSATYRGETRTVPYTGSQQCIDSIIVIGLLDGHTLQGVTYQICATNPGTTEGTPQGSAVVKHGEETVTDNYALTAESGSLTIVGSQQALVIRSKTDTSQYYNGANHTYQTYYVTYGGTNITADANSNGRVFTLPTGDKVTITPTGAGADGITHVPATPLNNEFSYELQNADNYSNVIADKGVISLKPRLVNIVSASFEKEYDGTRIFKNEATTAGMGFVEGDSINPVTWSFMNGTQYTEVVEGGYANQFDKPTFRTGTNPNDYDTTYVYGTLMINKATLTVKADDLTYTYGDPVPELTYTVNGFKGNDNESDLTGTPELSGAFSPETPVGVYSNSIAISQGTLTATNYDFDFVNGTMIVTYRPLHIKALPMDNITYDGEPHAAPSSNYSVVNEDLCTGHVVTSVSVNGSARLAGHHYNAINITHCTIKNANGVDVTSNYQLMSVDTFIHINAKPLTISVSKGGTCEYDGHPHCEDALKVLSNGLKYTVEGLVEKDAISHIAFSGGGTAYSEDAYPVNVNPNELFITNSDLEPNVNVKSCYDITYNPGNIRITPNYTPIKIESGSKNDFFYTGEPQQYIHYTVYYNGSTTNVTGPVISGGSRIFTLPTGDILTITPTASITQPSENPVANTFTYVLNNTGSYLGQRDTILGELRINNVSRKVEVISESATFPYDGIVHTYPYYTVKFDNAAVVTSTPETHIQIPTGHYVDITPTFAGVINVQYSEHNNTFTYILQDATGADVSALYSNRDTVFGTVEIVAFTPELVGDTLSKVYDGSALVAVGPEGQTTGTFWYSKKLDENSWEAYSTTAPSITNVGILTYKVKVHDYDNESTAKVITLKITAKALTITADDKTKVYDNTNDDPELTAMVTGAVANETINYTLSREGGQNVGNYTITVTAGNNPNYNVSVVPGTFRITPIPITVVAKSGDSLYNGSVQTLSGFETVEFTASVGGANVTYVVSGLTATASGTDAGTYTTNITGTAVVKVKNSEDVVTGNFNVQTTPGTLTISKRTVTLTSATDSKEYDGTPLTNDQVNVSGDGFANGEGATYDVTGTQTLVGGTPNTFTYALNTNTKAGNYNITTSIGTLTVNDRNTKYSITVVSNSSLNNVYDGTQKTVNGFETLNFTKLVGSVEVPFKVMGLSASVSGIDADTYPNVITGSAVVMDANDNDVTAQFTVDTTYGKLVITPITETVTVTIVGAHDSTGYDGEAHTITGYTATADNPLYDVNTNFTFTPATNATLVNNEIAATRTDVGTTNMGLAQDQFVNTNTNFAHVVFAVTDGYQKIGKVAMEVTVTGHTDSKVYNATKQEVTGYDLACTSALYDATKVSFTGDSIAEGTTVGEYPMGLASNQFGYTNNNIDVTFTVAFDGKLTITPATMEVTATGYDQIYDGAGHGITVTTLPAGATVTYSTDGETYVSSNPIYSNVGEHTVYYKVDMDNYTTATGSATVKITTKSLAITAKAKTYTYDGTAQGPVGTHNTDLDTYVTVSTLGTGDTLMSITMAGSQVNQGIYTNEIVPSGAVIKKGETDVTGNYEITYNNADLTINKLALAITANAQTYTYSGTAQGPVGEHSSDLDTYVTVGTLGTGDVLTNITMAGSQVNQGTYNNEIIPSGAVIKKGNEDVTGNYEITYNKANLTINKRDLTITLDTTKVYNGTAFVSTLTNASNGQTNGYTINGLQNNATLSGVVTSALKDANTYRDSISPNVAIITTDFTTNDDINNYNVSYDFKQVITTAPLTIKLDTTKVYDGNAFVSDYTATHNGWTITGLQNGATITAGEVRSADKDVDTYDYIGTSAPTSTDEMTIPTAFTTSDGISNYNVSYDLKQMITKATLTITTGTASREYNGQPLTALGNISGFVTPTGGEQETATFTVTGTITEVGGPIENSYSLVWDGTAKESDYTLSENLGTLEITAAPLTVTITGHTSTKPYNGSEQSVTGYEIGIPQGATLTKAEIHGPTQVADSTASGTNVKTTDDGKYMMGLDNVQFNTTNTNYEVSFAVTDGWLKIEKAPLTITANNLTTEYGTVNHNFTYSPSGFVGTDNSSVISGTVTYMGTATQTTATSVPGDYTIIPVVTGLSADNYYFASANAVNGTLTINANSTHITISSGSYNDEYDGQSHTAGYTVKYGEQNITADANSNGLIFTLPTNIKVTISHPTYITNVDTLPNTFTYTVDQPYFSNIDTTCGLLMVTPRTVNITVPDTSIEYNGSLHHGKLVTTAMFSGVVNGQIPHIHYTPAEGILASTTPYDNGHFNLSSFTVTTTPGGNDVTSNYKLGTLTKGKLTVTNRTHPYPITVVSKSNTGNVYDGQSHSAIGFDTLRFTHNNHIYTLSGLHTADPSSINICNLPNTITGTAVVKDVDSHDVTAQFAVTLQPGTLEIIHRHITAFVADDTLEFNGQERQSTKVPVFTNVVEGDIASIGYTPAHGTQIGDYFNGAYTPNSLHVVNANSEDVTANYYLSTSTAGKLTIAPPPLTVTAKDSTKTYDGAPLSASFTYYPTHTPPTIQYKVKNGETWSDYLDDGVLPSITNVGSLTYLVEATANAYTVRDTATLTITKRNVTVTVGDTLNIEYTGGEHHSEKEPVFSNVLPSQMPHIGYEHAKGTLVGTYYGQYIANSFVVMDGETEVTANYNLTSTTEGKMTIVARTPYEITVVAHSNTGNVYDGQPHSAKGYDTTVHVGGHYFTVEGLTTSNPTSTIACEMPNEFSGTAVVKDVHGNDVTDQFNVSTVNGLLKINKRQITLRSLPGIKMYNGTPLTVNEQSYVIVEGDDFVSGEGATYNITGSQTYVGMSYNTFTYTLNDGTLAGNYDITTQSGTLTVIADTSRISVASESEEWIYDGTSHRRDVYTVKYNNTLLDSVAGSNGKVFVLPTHDTLTVTSTFGGITAVGENAAHNNTFTYTLQHDDQYVGLRETVYGTLKILPLPVTVHIVGHAQAVTYDANPHTVTGYEVHEIDNLLYQEDYFQYTGSPEDSTATRTEVGMTPMSLTSSKFLNQNSNFDVTFVVTNGEIVVAPAGGVVVIISGNSNTVNYDGEPHQVTGYTIVSVSNPTYLESFITFTGSDTATRTEVGTTWMGLTPDQFQNTQSNFSNVVFQLQSDGYLTINRPEVLVDITGHHAVHVYDGANHSVQGYEVATTNPIYTRSKFTFSGDSVATQKDAGVKLMNLNESLFVNNDTNFHVIFEVLEDGYQEITPNTTALTLTCPAGDTVSKIYDGTPLSVAATASSTISGDTFEILYKTKLEGESTFSDWTATPPSITDYGILLVEVSCSNPNYQTQTCSYSLSIHKRDVHLASMDSTRLYNGDVLTYDSVAVSGHGFAQGEGATYAVTGSQLLPGTSPNEFTYTLNSNTKADNYQITTAYGTLHVGERPDSLLYPITVVSNSNPVSTDDVIIYDGLKHSDSNFVSLTFTTVDGHPYTVTGLTAKVSAFDAGTYPNTIHGEPIVLDEHGNNVTSQFNIELLEGHLVIRKHQTTITVPAEHATMMYNGDSLRVGYENVNMSYLAARDTLVGGYIITEGYAEGTYHCNDGNFMATDISGVASQHDFNIVHGASEEYEANTSLANYRPTFSVVLTITKRPLEITAKSAEKVYDGDPLTMTESDYILTNGTTLAPTDTLFLTRTGSQSCVGESANHITSVTILHKGDWVDVTSSYDITTVDGLLKVTRETDGLTCPPTLNITLTEDTYDTVVSQSLLGAANHALVHEGVATITNNLDEQNPLAAGTHTVTWILYDTCQNAMDTCYQTVEVVYTPCVGVTYHGHFYDAKRIGYQCWMTENLRNETDAEGHPIANRHAYKEIPENLDKFGYLYSWYSAMNGPEGDDTAIPADSIGDNGRPYVQGICPDGWAVGDHQDFSVLFDTVNNTTLLKDAGDGYWLPGFGGTLPNSGFNARANGLFNSAAHRFEDLLTGAHFWMPETGTAAGTATSAVLQYYCSDGLFQESPKGDLKGVRCIRKVEP